MMTDYIKKIKDEIKAKDARYIQNVTYEIIKGFDDAVEAQIRSSDGRHTGLNQYKYTKHADASGSWNVMGYPPTTIQYKILHGDICEKVREYLRSTCVGAWFDVGWETCPFEYSAPYVMFRIRIDWDGEKPQDVQSLEYHEMMYQRAMR
jgi:hypothetical protein